jgi:hypothetical protein
MFKKNVWPRVIPLLIIVSAVAAFPALAASPKSEHTVTGNYAVYGTGNMGALVLPPAGMGSIALINYDGGSEQLLVDVNGVDYVVPPAVNGTPNHVEINLTPGTYDYTASVVGIGTVARSVDVVAGQVTSLGFVNNPDQYHTSASAGALLYFQGDMTAQAQ